MAQQQNMFCVNCGKLFDASKRGNQKLDDNNLCLCDECARSINTKSLKLSAAETEEQKRSISEAYAAGDINENQAVIATHKHGKGKMIAGIIVAAVGVIGFAGGSGQGIAYYITCVIILLVGAGLLTWHFIADKKFKEAVQAERDRSLAEQQAEIQLQENLTKTCPHCGGFTKGKFCEYCGSQLEQ